MKMDVDSNLTTGPSDDGVQSLSEHVFSENPKQTRRVSSIMADLNLLLLEYSNEEKETYLLDLEEILDPSGEDAEVDISSFENSCRTWYNRHQKSAIFSPCASPVKGAAKIQDFSPVKCASLELSPSDSEFSICSSPSADLFSEHVRLKEEYRSLKLHNVRWENLNHDLITKLSNSEDKIAELEIRCKDLYQWKSNYKQRESNFHDAQSCDAASAAKESQLNQLLEGMKRLEKELDKQKRISRTLEDKVSDMSAELAEKAELQSQAEMLFKQREDDSKILLEAKSQIKSLETKLCAERQVVETLRQSEKEQERVIRSLEGYKAAVKYVSRQNDELAAVLDDFQRMRMCDTSDDDEESALHPVSLRDELGGSFHSVNTSCDLDESILTTWASDAERRRSPAVLRVNVEPCRESGRSNIAIENLEDRSTQLRIIDDLATQLLQYKKKVAELEMSNAKLTDAAWHPPLSPAPGKALLAFGSSFLLSLFFGYLLVGILIFVLSPYLDHRLLLRSKPWFVFVGEGALKPPPT